MATIELSDGFITSGVESGYTRRIINGADNKISLGGLCGSSSAFQGQLFILKGAVPTSFAGLTTWGARSSDVLLNYLRYSLNQINITFPGNNTMVFNTIYKNATASGTATWFWMITAQSDSSSSTIFQQFIGTVGTQGSGADMEISNTTVTSGNPYRVISSTITLPTSWTY